MSIDNGPWLRRSVLKLGRSLLRGLERIVARHSLIGDHPIFESDVFPWAADLEAAWRTIRREVDGILAFRGSLPSFQDISKDQIILTKDDQWKTFFLYGMGIKAKQNCAQCPATTRLIEQVPGMTTAFFSILGPRKHIPAHRGVFNGFIRYHLGLIVPEPNEQCRIRVHDQVAHWKEGHSLIFDDSYEHEVWNDTNGERVVLFMDVLRPLPAPLALLNRLLLKAVSLSPYVQDAKKNFRQWENKLNPPQVEQGVAE